MCLRQFIRPKERPMVEGVGDCTTCVTDEKNKNCKMYYEITIDYLELESTTPA